MTSDNKWIEDAFKKAQKEAERTNPTARIIRDFLDNETPTILDKWSRVVGQERAIKLAKKLAADDELGELIETLAETFAVAGYIYCKSRYEHKGRI